MAAVRTRLMAHYAPATVNRYLSALRSVLEECWRLDLIGERECRLAVDVPNVSDDRLPAGRSLPDRELWTLLLGCYADSDKGVRDLAVLGLLATTGLRRAEVADLHLKDFDPADGALRVRGKGRKERVVYVVNTTRRLLNE